LRARSRQRTGQRKSHLRRRSGSQPRNDYISGLCRFAPVQRPARPNSSVRPEVSPTERISASIFLWTNTPLTLTPLPYLLEKAGAWGESQHGWHSTRRTFHFCGCVPVRSNPASVSRSNQKQALIWSSALEFERKPDLRATGFQLFRFRSRQIFLAVGTAQSALSTLSSCRIEYFGRLGMVKVGFGSKSPVLKLSQVSA
jgi:hypothetical protein